MELTISFQNRAPTNAIKVRSYPALTVTKPSEMRFDYPPFDETDASQMNIPPQAPLTSPLRSDSNLPAETLADINSGARVLYTFTKMTYCDEFGQGYELYYCMKYEPTTKTPGTQFYFCPVYNEELLMSNYCPSKTIGK